MLFGFLAVNFTALKGFSFQGTIDGVEAVAPLRVGAGSLGDAGKVDGGLAGMGAAGSEVPPRPSATSEPAVDALEGRCAETSAAFGLTPRESEILSLLAHGRNAAYIQEKLVLSRNTVKTHVQNIYAKLGVHSQQELIDVVEAAGK